MTVLELIKKHALLVRNGKYNFVFGDEAYQNAIADRKKFPIIFLDAPLTMDGDMKKSAYIEQQWPLKFAILWSDKIDATPEQSQPLVDKAMTDAQELVRRIADDTKEVNGLVGRFKAIGGTGLLDAHASGCLLFFTIIKRQTDAACID